MSILAKYNAAMEAKDEAASIISSPIGRETKSPRIDGMMQKLQRWLQPSEIFR